MPVAAMVGRRAVRPNAASLAAWASHSKAVADVPSGFRAAAVEREQSGNLPVATPAAARAAATLVARELTAARLIERELKAAQTVCFPCLLPVPDWPLLAELFWWAGRMAVFGPESAPATTAVRDRC